MPKSFRRRVVKLPEPPATAAMRGIPPDVEVLPAGTRLYRIYFRGGEHLGGWGRFRDFGPLPSARFDHHPEPAGGHERAILYAALREDASPPVLRRRSRRGGWWIRGCATHSSPPSPSTKTCRS